MNDTSAALGQPDWMQSLSADLPKRVVVRPPNWLGDAVMAIPALRTLSALLDPEELCIVTRKGLGNFVARYPFVDTVVEFAPGDAGVAHADLRGRGYDAIVLFTNSFRSALDAWKTGCRARVGYGGNFRGWLLTHRLKKPSGLHMTDYYLRLATGAHVPEVSREIDFPLLPAEMSFASSLGDLGPAIGIPLGARYGSAKCWPTENLRSFIAMLMQASGNTVILFGTAQERAQADELSAINPQRIVNLTGSTTIGEMAAVMARCEWVVANDSGPLHVAAALGKNTIALFGATDAAKTAPRSANVTIIDKHADCAPCLRRTCPTDHRCVKGITAEEVFSLIVR